MPKSLKEKKAEAAAKAAAKVEANEEKKAKLKAKEDAKREKIKADKITKREAAAKGAVTTALKNLAPIAKEINVRFEKAAQMEDDAYDHRLAASLRLKDASDICKKTKGVTFKVYAGQEQARQCNAPRAGCQREGGERQAQAEGYSRYDHSQ